MGDEPESEPERRAGGAWQITDPKPLPVGPLPDRGGVLVAPDQLRGLSQQREVVETERLERIGCRQLRVCLAPRSRPVAATGVEGVKNGHAMELTPTRHRGGVDVDTTKRRFHYPW